MKRVYEKIGDKVYRVGDVIYFRAQVNGKRLMERAPVQGRSAIDERGRVTKALKAAARNWYNGKLNERYYQEQTGGDMPTLGQAIDLYEAASVRERIKCGKPVERSVEGAVSAIQVVMRGVGLTRDDSADKFTRKMFDQYILEAMRAGISPVTAWSNVKKCKCVVARWTEPYFEEAGFKKPAFDIPTKRGNVEPRYKELPPEQLARVAAWYHSLEGLEDKRYWLAATMMLQFAMRDADVGEMTMENFKDAVGADGVRRTFLAYTPRKTSNSSGRDVYWPVSDEMVAAIEAAVGAKRGSDAQVITGSFNEFMRRINASVRVACGFTGSKGMYELRKICVNTIYKKFGVERASAISGDSIPTLTRYYSDPSRATADAIDIAAAIV